MKSFLWALLVALIVKTGIYAEEFKLRFLPFGEIVYFYGLWGENEKFTAASPQVYKTRKVFNKTDFEYGAYSILNDFSPPKDLRPEWGGIPLTKFGATNIWKELKFEFPNNTPLDAKWFVEYPLLFPYFPKDQYKIGEQWEMNLFAPITFTCALDLRFVDKMKTFFRSNSKVVFKFERITDMFGFKCAEINYHIADSLKAETGKMMRFNCIGTTFFAINEGFIVSEMMEIKHDQQGYEKEVVHKVVKRKLRMLNYKRFSGQQ